MDVKPDQVIRLGLKRIRTELGSSFSSEEEVPSRHRSLPYRGEMRRFLKDALRLLKRVRVLAPGTRFTQLVARIAHGRAFDKENFGNAGLRWPFVKGISLQPHEDAGHHGHGLATYPAYPTMLRTSMASP